MNERIPGRSKGDIMQMERKERLWDEDFEGHRALGRGDVPWEKISDAELLSSIDTKTEGGSRSDVYSVGDEKKFAASYPLDTVSYVASNRRELYVKEVLPRIESKKEQREQVAKSMADFTFHIDGIMHKHRENEKSADRPKTLKEVSDSLMPTEMSDETIGMIDRLMKEAEDTLDISSYRLLQNLRADIGNMESARDRCLEKTVIEYDGITYPDGRYEYFRECYNKFASHVFLLKHALTVGRPDTLLLRNRSELQY